MNNSVSSDQVKAMISKGNWRALSEIMDRLHPAAIADLSEPLSEPDVWRLFDHASVGRQATIFPFLSMSSQVAIVRRMGRERTAQLLEACLPTIASICSSN